MRPIAAARHTTILLPLALAGAAVFIAGLWLDLAALRLYSKPLPALCLALWVALSAAPRERHIVSIALLLCMLGDILLELQYRSDGGNQQYFALGLGSFLLGHLAYLVFFLRIERTAHLVWLLPFLLWGIFVYSQAWPRLGPLALPVAVYISVICCMMWRALTLVDQHGRHLSLAQGAAWGALLFGASDSMIAFNRFVTEFTGARYLIIVSYWLGLYGIARYCVLRPDLQARRDSTMP